MRIPGSRRIVWLSALAPALPALAFLLIFLAWPLARVVQVSLVPGDLSRGETLFSVLSNPSYAQVLRFTVAQAALSTALTLLCGLPVAFTFARYRFPGDRLWRALTIVPFVMPTVVVAAAFSALLGLRGAVNLLLQSILSLDQPPIQLQGTLAMILLAHVFYNLAVVVRIVGGFLSVLDPRLEEAALTLGAGRWQIFWFVLLPLALPSIGAAAALTFLFTFTSFGVVLLLGGARFATVEVEIYRQAAQLLRLDVATSLAILQMVVALLVSLVSAWLERQASVPVEAQSASDIRVVPRTRAARALVALALFTVLLLILPLGALFLRSLDLEDGLQSGAVFRFYAALSENRRNSFLFVPPLEAIRNSLVFAVATALLVMALGVLLAYAVARGDRQRLPASRWIESALLLPLGASTVVLGLGYVLAFNQPPLSLGSSPVLIPLAHTLIALPLVVRAILAALRALDPELREAAQNLGANAVQIFRYVELPLLIRPFTAAAVFGFAVSLGEFGAALLIARPEYPTMPVVIYRFLGQPGALNYGQALAMSSILMLVTVLSALAIERLNERLTL